MALPLTVPSMTAGADFVLRPWEMSDLPLVREAAEDDYIPLITTIPSPYSDEAAEAYVRRQWDRAAAGAGYPFTIARTRDRRPVGFIELRLTDAAEGRAALRYWMTVPGRGQGVTGAALRTVTTWALHELGIPRVQALVEPWNTASVRTAESAGYRCEGLLRGWQEIGGRRRDMLMYARLNDDRPPGDRPPAAG
ncbi:GNAT family N-acetyltransferase [Streptomyces sp. NPDC056796]|uniref:GNAT family N-acetyltransferase n=1 Tax=Streptomyces sp. NPDC056796 TaxID=3345947 RepID=UPI0036BA2B98